MGMSLDEVILRSTWNPAKEIQHEELGNLSVGSPADVAVLRLQKGKFGFVDQSGGRLNGTERLLCEMTLRDGTIVYDMNGMSAIPWEQVPERPAGRGQAPADSKKK
jgi:dihydroorotase